MDKLNIGSNSFLKDGWLNLDKTSSRYTKEQSNIDIQHNLMSSKPILLDNESLVAAYTSHTIEHITDESVFRLFSEVYRMLEGGGAFRVTCPDIGKCYNSYILRDKDYIGDWLANVNARPSFKSYGLGEQFVFIFASYLSRFSKRNGEDGVDYYTEEEIEKIFKRESKVDALNYFTKECQEQAIHLQEKTPGNHISWWDFDKIKSLMETVGFVNVSQKVFNESNYEVFKNFDELNKDSVTQKDYTVFVEAEK
jgi:predicted SAM-dependent methyltransferase